MGPLNAPALRELCALLETPGQRLLPDAIWLGGQAPLYRHLRDCEALSLSGEVASEVLCPDCLNQSLAPQAVPGAPGRYQALCFECGAMDLPKERVRLWQAEPGKVADWLSGALGLKVRHQVTAVIPGVLWHLGEREIRRQRRSFFFGCQIDTHAAVVNAQLDALAAPGAQALITTTDLAALKHAPLASRLLIPLRAVAQLRKGHLTLEPLDGYFDGLAPPVTSDETSLRLLHTRRVVLIGGTEHKLSPQVYGFLKVLEDADGDEVPKREIAQALGIPETFRYADIKKHHRLVFDTFVQSDHKGNFWLIPEYLILERG